MTDNEPISLTIAPPGAGPHDKDLKLVVGNMLKSDSIMHLKRTIARDIRRPAEWSNIKLYWMGDRLDDDKTLADYGIDDADEILQVGAFDLGPRAKPASSPSKSRQAQQKYSTNGVWSRPVIDGPHIDNIFFKDLSGRTFTLNNIAVKSTVRQLKEILWREKDLDKEYLRFMFAGKPFEDDKTLEHYQIEKECTVMILARLPGGVAF